jgi:hypothetical protein
MIGLFIAILLSLFFFGQFLGSDDLSSEQDYFRRTATANLGLHQTVEAEIRLTQTAADISTGTNTPVPAS